MSTADPDHSTALSDAPAPAHARSAAARRMRVADTLLLVACLLFVTGAFLPWVTVDSVNHSSGLVTRLLTWHVWSVGCGVLFPLLAIPQLHLARTGWRAMRGQSLNLGRWSAVRLSLAGFAGTAVFFVLVVITAGFLTFSPYWGRFSQTDILMESGFPVSLASYTLAMIASLLLPARAGG